MSERTRVIRALIGTVGGQGGGVLSDWLVKGLLNAGWQAQSIGLLGLSQRAGSVIYYVEARPPGGEGLPILSAHAVPGDVDLLLAQEFLELGRLLQGGFAAENCTIVANTYRYYGTLEKMPAEGGIYPSGVIRKAAETLSSDSYLFHAQDVVAQAGLSHLSSNAVLLGAAVASRVFNIEAEPFRAAIQLAEVGVGDNLKAFDLGYRLMREGTLPRNQFRETPTMDWEQLAEERATRLKAGDAKAYRAVLEEGRSALPELSRIYAEALYRLVDFQSAAYARDYLRRVEAMASSERAAGRALPTQTFELPATAAYARHLGAWMGYEDAPRVAQLKTRPERFAALRKEHRIKANESFLVEDFLAPDPPQLYGMLPAPVGSAVRKLGCMLFKNFDEMAWTMRVRTSSPFGYYTMRMVAAMRRLRPISYRHAQEMRDLARWTAAVQEWVAQDATLGLLAADAGRLVKGYGRIRNLALDDLWRFLDDALPLLAQLGREGGDTAALGDQALRVIAGEAGKGPAGLEFLHTQRARLRAAA